MRRLGGFVVALAVLFGMKAWNLRSAKTDIHDKMIELCEKDSKCEEAVATHFDACFDEHSSMGGKNSGAKVDGTKLVQCVNQRSGVDYFAYDEDEK